MDYPEIKDDVPHYSIDEYKSKLEEIIRNQNEKLRVLAEQQAKEINAEALRESEEMLSQSQKKAEAIIAEYKRKALTDRDEIVKQAENEASNLVEKANQEAQQIISQAEENARTEAKNRVQSEVEKMITRTRQECDSITSSARQEGAKIIDGAKEEAEKQSQEMLERYKQEAEVLIKDEIEKCRGETKEQVTQVFMKAEKSAKRLINDIINDSQQLQISIKESVSNLENMVVKMKEDMQIEFGELTKQGVEANSKIETKITSFIQENKGEIEGIPTIENSKMSGSIWVISKGEESSAEMRASGCLKGKIELKALSSFDRRRIDYLTKLFSQIPSVKYMGESSSDQGIKLEYNLVEPVPLFDILKNIPWIDRVVEKGKNLKLDVH